MRELATGLAREGAIVLYGACDAVVTTPYGPFVEALDPLIRGRDPSLLRTQLGSGAAELARLLPDLSDIVGGLPAPLVADADTERHRLHTAITALLTAVGARAPVLLVLEDVHWADPPSLLLVRHLVRAGADVRMLLVATFRDLEADMSDALSELLVDAGRAEGVVRTRLGGLGDADVSEVVRLATGAEASPDVAQAIVTLTSGNAFLLTELWRELVDSGALEIGPTARSPDASGRRHRDAGARSAKSSRIVSPGSRRRPATSSSSAPSSEPSSARHRAPVRGARRGRPARRRRRGGRQRPHPGGTQAAPRVSIRTRAGAPFGLGPGVRASSRRAASPRCPGARGRTGIRKRTGPARRTRRIITRRRRRSEEPSAPSRTTCSRPSRHPPRLRSTRRPTAFAWL